MCHLLHQVITHKLFISGMKPEPWWQPCLYQAYIAHFSFNKDIDIRDGNKKERRRIEKEICSNFKVINLRDIKKGGEARCIYKWERVHTSGQVNL